MTTADELRALDGTVMAALSPSPADAVLVVGSVDRALAIAHAVGPDGHVLAIDAHQQVHGARRRADSIANLTVIGAAGDLRLAHDSFDRALLETDHPGAVSAVRSGGIVVVVRPDWLSLILNLSNTVLRERAARAVAGNGHDGLQHVMGSADLAVVSDARVTAHARRLPDLALLHDLSAELARAVTRGALDLDDADELFRELDAAESAAEVLASLTTRVVTARRR
jgi:hypothetical protein